MFGLLCAGGSAPAQNLVAGPAAQHNMKTDTFNEPEYRKFDESISSLRARNEKKFVIDPAKGIDESSFVTIGGIGQWVTIRGEDRANPVLLFLHGGPGDVSNPWGIFFFASWERYFTVVQWDERGAGKTLRKNGPGIAPTMTLDRMAQDGIELTEFLRKHLEKEKIIVVAHSFGSVLGLRMMRARPELFYAYVGTGQVSDETRNYSATYDALVKKALAVGNRQAIEELKSIGPPPYENGAGYRVQWRWANGFEGADRFLMSTIGLILVAPGGSAQDFNDSERGEIFSGEHLVPQLHGHTPKDFGLEFSVPMFFFQGAEDFTASTELARQYLAMIHAPRKEFVPIENGGHFAVYMRSEEFLKALLARVRPLAVGRQDGQAS